MPIETVHRGYKIIYSENNDEWVCYDAGYGFSGPSLTKLKEKIDRMLLAERKVSAVNCLELHYGTPEAIDATVIEYLGPKTDRSFQTGKLNITDHKVAVTATRRGRSKASRIEGTLSNFVADTPEAREAIAEAAKAYEAARLAEAHYQACRKAIPRITLDMIAPLVRISGIDPEAKDKVGGK